MTLQQLEYVMAVYRFKHFARAAEYCKVTQPTLSSMIQKLEEELGVKIFERSSQPIRPTAVGQQIIAQGWRVIRRADKIRDIVAEEKSELCGTFTIGILPTIAPYLIPRFFPQLMNRNPSLDIRVVEMKTEEIKRALPEGSIDAGILAHYENMDKFNVDHLFFEQFFVYVSQQEPVFEKERIKTTDLTNGFLWLLDEGHCFREQLVKFCQMKAARRSKKAYSLGSIETFMRIVEGGKGITFIPELAVLQLSDYQRLFVRPFAIPVPVRDVVLLTTKDFIRHTWRKFIVGEIQQSVPQEMLELKKIYRQI